MEDFDKLWDYDDPAGTETKFREVLSNSSFEKNTSYHLQLLTQIARTYSLRFMFDEAHRTLNEVQQQLPETNGVEHVRYHLERGRTYNWQKNRPEAKKHFEQATSISRLIGQDGYYVDALHMLAIIAPADEAVAINEEAILFAEKSEQESAKRWLGVLYNNLGWSYFERKEYEKAMDLFLRTQKYCEDRKRTRQVFIAKWSVAKTLRLMGRADEALKMQLALLEETVATGYPDGYVHEELGELLLQSDKIKSAYHFQKAHELLSVDEYLRQHEAERLSRIKELACA